MIREMPSVRPVRMTIRACGRNESVVRAAATRPIMSVIAGNSVYAGALYLISGSREMSRKP
tara:strand:+ start:455 stop:637 length:183 start_codon:yes stop_codon:yes gene_type:complete